MTRETARAVLEALSAQELDKNTRELLVEYLTQNTPKQNTPVLLETTHEMQYHTEGGQTVMTMAEALLKEGAAPEFVQRTTGLTPEGVRALQTDETPEMLPQQD